MATIFVENRPYEVKDGQNLLQACVSLGFDLPYFCWHPAMHSVGACRQCAVKAFRDEKDEKGRIVMACMTAATEGARISIADPEARAFRRSVTEWMMINHPHDCPVCDEGGECHLQDMTYMTGHTYRRFRGKKRTFRNQDMGPFVNHEMNRCIQCYRCVRFYRDHAGGRDFDAFLSNHLVYFGRNVGGVLESEFSGNLVEVCPTGVFTDKTLSRHFTRKWDLQTAPSVCVHCSLGCNTIPGERYGVLRRILNRYNGDVNGYFLCDRGRFGYEFVNSPSRLREPLVKALPDQHVIDVPSILEKLKSWFSANPPLIGIGSPRASLEANFALRTLVGPDHFYAGVSGSDHRLIGKIIGILKDGPTRAPSLREMAEADAVLVLGEDVTNTAPMAAFALRQSVRTKPMEIPRSLKIPDWDATAVKEALQDARGPLYSITPLGTKLDEIATRIFHAPCSSIARLGYAVAGELGAGASPRDQALSGLPEEEAGLAREIATALAGAERPLIVAGTSLESDAIVEAAADIAWALSREGRNARLSYILPECNSMGLGLIGGNPLAEALCRLREGFGGIVIVLENDLFRRLDRATVNGLLKARTIVLDCIQTPSALAADLALPAATFAESDGTLVNNEGRAQRYYAVFSPRLAVRASWCWLRDAAVLAGSDRASAWSGPDDVLNDLITEMSGAFPELARARGMAPPAGFRIAGAPVARQPHRYSGRTAMLANVTVHEPPPPADPDTPLSFSMEGFQGEPPPELIPRFWAPGWNSVQSVNKFQSQVGGALKGGNPGRRLFEADSSARPSFFSPAAAGAEFEGPRAGEFLIVPSYHIFGSEELSALSPGIASLSPGACVSIHPEDAERIGRSEQEIAAAVFSEDVGGLSVRKDETIPRGVIAVPSFLWSSLRDRADDIPPPPGNVAKERDSK